MKCLFLAVLLGIVPLCAVNSSFAQELSPEKLYEKVLPSVATLTVSERDGQLAMGTGFLAIKDGVLVTSWHLVKDAAAVSATFANGEVFEASGVIDKDEARDVVLLRIKLFGRPLLPLATTEQTVGSKAYVIGAPKGLEFSISDGLLSQVQMLDGIKFYQFTCAASPGNSGGPLLNARGEVIGVVSWQIKEGQNLNFAIPSLYVLGLDASLSTKAWGQVDRSKLAVGRTAITDETEIDQWLAKGYTLVYDTFVCDIYLEQVLTKPIHATTAFGEPMAVVVTVPPVLYATMTRIQNVTAALNAMTLAGDRNVLKQYILTALSQEQDVLDSVEKCILMIQHAGGWSSEARNFHAKIIALERPDGDVPVDALHTLLASPAFFYAVEVVMKSQYDPANPRKLKLGILALSTAPLYIVDILPNAFAGELKLTPGDRIVSVNNEDVKSLAEFRTKILRFTGQIVDIQVDRKGNTRKLRIKIPQTIPDKYIEHKPGD